MVTNKLTLVLVAILVVAVIMWLLEVIGGTVVVLAIIALSIFESAKRIYNNTKKTDNQK
ncbi:hypothetical protein [Vibrio sp. D431a]|uniref:hypothetical protein n=1 Tax=Vibrio sp. D431a TaxID=2837388 RepID=UPI0025546501|nr:hypothetical protein [Vibrio sp. D431a]MDK9789906.1 hypothetical protein [Vibrio sp. D431a]